MRRRLRTTSLCPSSHAASESEPPKKSGVRFRGRDIFILCGGGYALQASVLLRTRPLQSEPPKRVAFGLGVHPSLQFGHQKGIGLGLGGGVSFFARKQIAGKGLGFCDQLIRR